MFGLGVLVALVTLGWGAASAQVYEWRDANGSRHFTNALADIPDAQRDGARVVVRADAAIDVDSPEEVADEETPRERRRRERRERYAREPVRSAQVVYDNSFRFRRPSPPPPAPEVHINIDGPLAVSQVIVPPSPPAVVIAEPLYDFYYGPMVSTSFDRGRSRHRTVRMRLQDQFQYDRNGPSIYVAGRVPLGPRFRTSLPRGVRSCEVSQRSTVLRR